MIIIVALEDDMADRLTRNDVAKRIGVKPITIYRWEKRGISPVTPHRIIRTNELVYTEEDVAVFETWMNKTEVATIGRHQ
jgi:predicted site-specific integrase-resolvase